MNRSHYCCACAAVLFIAVLSGCHGLSGVRYHDGLVGDDPTCKGCDIADAGLSAEGSNTEGSGVLVGEMDATVPVAAPHPRFHPLPTRPVFEPDRLEFAAEPTPVASAATTGSSAGKPTAASVLAKPSRSTIRLASADAHQVARAGVHKEIRADAHKVKEGETQPSSRRRPVVKIEAFETPCVESIAPAPIEVDEPVEELTPVAESSSDMWRPRVGKP